MQRVVEFDAALGNSIGEHSLLGANAGIGISLGDNCVVEAGLYVTAGTKIEVFDKEKAAAGPACITVVPSLR